MKYSSRKKGETLVELILYVVMLALIMIVVINTLVTIMQSYRLIKVDNDIESSAIISMDRMEREIRNATSINTASSTFNKNPGVLSLTSTNASSTTTILKFYVVSSSTLSVDVNGTYSGPLTLSDVTVSNLVFRLATTTNSTAVKIEMTLTSGTSTNYRSDKFYDTAILRGSY